MATSQTAICNLALDAIGARATISDLTEGSAESAACLRQYQPALEATLQAAHWNFARKQATLTLLKDGTLTPPDTVPTPWLYEYAQPSDMLQGRYILGLNPASEALVGYGMGSPTPAYPVSSAVRFIFSSDLDSGNNAINVILTNQPQAVLVYTYRVANPNLFDSQFTRAFANYLGYLLVMPLNGDKSLGKDCYQIADMTCRAAMASDGNEGLTIINSVPDWIMTRGFTFDDGHSVNGQFLLPPISLPAVY